MTLQEYRARVARYRRLISYFNRTAADKRITPEHLEEKRAHLALTRELLAKYREENYPLVEK